MTPRITIAAALFLGLCGLGCGNDPVVGNWKGSKQNLAFEPDGTLRSLESAALTGTHADECESAGQLEEVEKCTTGGWASHGDGYKLKTSTLVVLDGGSRLNCKCTHSVLYAELADANLVIYDRVGGHALDRMSR